MMAFVSRSWIAGALLLLLATGCSTGASRSAPEPPKRWVLVSNFRYSAQGSEPEYVWVEEDKIPTSLSTVLFGKKAIIASPEVVRRYGPPPRNGLISPLQGGRYAADGQQAAVVPAAVVPPAVVVPKDAPSGIGGRPVAPGSAGPAAPSAVEVTPRGYVVYLEGNRVVIDLSAQQGLKAGDLLKITREKIPVVHPVTGAYLGELEEEIATVQVVQLREKFAVAVIKELAPGAQIRIKDRVVPAP